MQLHLRPHLIDDARRMNDDTLTNPFAGDLAVAVFAERRRDTRDGTGVMGDATAATSQKGKRIYDLACERLAALCRDYHELPVRHYREFGSHST